MQHQKPALVSKNELVIRKMDGSFKKAACRIKDAHVAEIIDRVRKILQHAQCVGTFNMGFLTNRREANLVEGQIDFRTVSVERRWVTFLVQPTNTNSRAEFWLSLPDTMDGNSFLAMVKEAHAAVEPDGMPLKRGRAQYVITENGGECQQADERIVVPLQVKESESSGPCGAVHGDTESSSIDTLQSHFTQLSKPLENAKRAQVRRGEIVRRRLAIQHTVDDLANEDQALQQELEQIDASMPNLEAIEQTLKTLKSLLK